MRIIRHKFKVGDRVRHRSTGQMRTIARLHPDIDENYELDEKVDGFYSWSTQDLELAQTDETEPTDGVSRSA